MDRLKADKRPFGSDNFIEKVISDGFYAVFHKRWQQVFPEEQLLVIDGSQYRKKN